MVDLIGPDRQRDNLNALATIDWPALDQAVTDLPPEQQQTYAPFLAQLSRLSQQVQAQALLTPQQFWNHESLRAMLSPFFNEIDGETFLRLPLSLGWEGASEPAVMQQLVAQLGLPLNGDYGQIGDAMVGTAGPPTIAWTLSNVLSQDLERLAGLAALTTIILLLILLHNVRTAAIAALALSLGLVASLAFMVLFNQPFNLMNISVVPLVIGIGIDNGIHLLHAIQHAKTRRELQQCIETIGHPILITALTSMIGFGSLGLNAFQGIQSIGFTACLGIVACVWMAMLAIPLIKMRSLPLE